MAGLTVVRKAQPNVNSVHIKRPLTNISTAYMQSEEGFIANKVFPVVPVSNKTDQYYVFNKNDFLRDDAVKRRTDGQESSGSGYTLSTDTYNCEVWATHKDVGPQMLANSDPGLNPDQNATRFVTGQVMIHRERRWTTKYFSTDIWDKDYTGVASSPTTNEFVQFDNFAQSNPRETIRIARLYILKNTGQRPNTLVIGEEVYEVLREHPDLAEIFKYADSGLINTAKLAETFMIPNIIIGGAVYATNAEGASSEAYDFIHGKKMWLGYVNPNPGLMEPSAGYMFAWSGLLGGNAFGGRIARIPTPLLGEGSRRIEIENAYDMKVVGSDLGALFDAAIS